ncbi:MAG: elongation factor 4 [Candidatus Margulisbacteria bacterium]|nr:elongation factor 4 [Candidatus Margulisiibacteriota bacterium]
MSNLRNFSIIAHIDHGKSTLSDRLIQFTHTVADRDMKAQLLDSMDLERERGITIKMQAVRLDYVAKDGKPYILNLIDTPGHVDFTYEVSRSLAACEGALLIVDATQGIEAQTLANFYIALENNLEIIPIINKIDLPSADANRVAEEIERVLGIPQEQCVLCSAKTGIGVQDILEAIVKHIPAPKPLPDQHLKALIFDAHFDPYRGVISYVRVFSGALKKGQRIKMMSNDRNFEILELGFFKPKMMPSPNGIQTGEVGYMIGNSKDIGDARVGDTITDYRDPAQEPLAGYTEAKPMVFCGFYPVDTNDFEGLKDALEKLKLNDASLHFETESSQALGFGYRCGFLGLLHMEIIQQRIEREYNIDIVVTSPNVTYRITKTNGEILMIENPSKFPTPQEMDMIEEPFMGLSIICPNGYMGTVIELAQESRGLYKKAEFIDADRQQLTFSIPLNELITNFFDKLKSRTKGYASMDYWLEGYQASDVVKVNMLINAELVDALSFIAHRDKAPTIGRKMAEKLKELIPRQMYEVSIQGAIGGKIICRETIKALRKNVIAKCYGGDISRKRKLLEKQKAGKKKMKSIGSIEVPKEAFLSVLKIDS